jgi:transposase
MADLFWLSDEQWAVLEPFMPKNQPVHGAWMIGA